MAADHRLVDNMGQRINFSCGNRRYKTNLNKGFAHGGSPTPGNVFQGPLINHVGYTLWLEHVEEIATSDEVYWLMLYDQAGIPTIPLSGIFDKNELAEMIRQLAGFLP